MNPLDYRRDELRVVLGDREPLVDEAASDAQPSDDLIVLEPAERQRVARPTDDVLERAMKTEYPLPVTGIPHAAHRNGAT